MTDGERFLVLKLIAALEDMWLPVNQDQPDEIVKERVRRGQALERALADVKAIT